MEKQKNREGQPGAGRVHITYVTDPLCCWSWAFEPEWRKLLYEYEGLLSWRYCMGGLLPAWQNFNDPVNSVSRPVQMGPVWMHASQLSGMPMQATLWMKDPPVSSYPACIAVKCAQLQSEAFGDTYLRLLREALMLQGKNIAREEVLLQTAEALAQQTSSFDMDIFRQQLFNGEGLEAFKADMQEVKQYNITRFPTLIIRNSGQPSVLLSGYRPYAALVAALGQAAPGITPTQKASSKEVYAAYWPGCTDRELEESIREG